METPFRKHHVRGGSSTIHDPTVPHCGSAPVRAKQPWWAGALGVYISKVPVMTCAPGTPEFPVRGTRSWHPGVGALHPQPSFQGGPCSQGGAGSGDWPKEGSLPGVWVELGYPTWGAWCGTRSSREEEGGFLAGQESTLHMAPCSRAESRSLPWNLTFQVILKA